MHTTPTDPSAKEEACCHMDLYLTKQQHASYERAAELSGKTLTQWATTHLDESAWLDINNAPTTYLSPEAFDTFCEMLEEPLPDALKQFLASKTIWE